LLFGYFHKEFFPGSRSGWNSFFIMCSGCRGTPEMEIQERLYLERRELQLQQQQQLQEQQPNSTSTFYEQEIYGSRGSSNYYHPPTAWTNWSIIQIIVLCLMMLFFAFDFDVCVVSCCAGAILMVVTAYKRQYYDLIPFYYEVDENKNLVPIQRKKGYDLEGNEIPYINDEDLVTESETTLTEIDYNMILLFIGQFILLGSFDDTGVPKEFFQFLLGETCYDSPFRTPCLFWFVTIIMILSNVVYNVALCQMLASSFPYLAPYGWCQVAFAATIAGNFTIVGSAANMIVSFQASKVGDDSFTMKNHAAFGIPSTLICLFCGTALIQLVNFSKECSTNLGECD